MFFKKLFGKEKEGSKNRRSSAAKDGGSLPNSNGTNGTTVALGNLGQRTKAASSLQSPPISLPRHYRSSARSVYDHDDYPHPDEEEEDSLPLDIPPALRPQVTRDDFDPLGILGRGSFATVLLVRAKAQLGQHLESVAASRPGSVLTNAKVGAFGSASPTKLSSSPKGKTLLASSPNKNTSKSNYSAAVQGYGKDKDLFAMKIIAKRRLIDSKRMKDVFTERDVLTKSTHPYLLKLHFTFQSEHKLFFVMDYMPGGDIRQLINAFRRRREPMPYAMARLLAAEVTLALTHLHDHGILYRDLKPENILLSEEGHCALADFGLSKDFGDLWMDEDEEIMRLKEKIPSMRATSFVGSPLYVAPEVLLREKYSRPIDFWGLGILIFTLLFGAEPFRGSNAKEIFDKILGTEVRFPTSMTTTPEAMDIIVRLLQKDPQQRLGAPEVFGHPFFRGLDWTAVMRQEVKPEGWVPPPPIAILSSDGNSSRSLGGNDAHLAPPSSHHHVGHTLGSQPTTRGRGMSEIYTPEHHAGQLPGSQQMFFENFSWTNVDHLYAISGENEQIVLSDGTVINGGGGFHSERSYNDSGSDFYDAPVPETPVELHRSFSDLSPQQQHSSAQLSPATVAAGGAGGAHGFRKSYQSGTSSKSSNNRNSGNYSGQTSPAVSFRGSRESKPYRPNARRPTASDHSSSSGSAASPVVTNNNNNANTNTAASYVATQQYHHHQPRYRHPDMAAGHHVPATTASVAQGGAVTAPTGNAQQHGNYGGSNNAGGSFFVPPPTAGFDSTLSL